MAFVAAALRRSSAVVRPATTSAPLRATPTTKRRGLASAAPATPSARFNKLSDADVAFFRRELGDSGVITDEGDLEPMNRDWMKKYRGQSRLALQPRTTAQVSAVLRHCNERRLAVVPQGGNTGLVGGGVPVFDEIIVSLSKMNAVQQIDELAGSVVCQAGVVLEQLDRAVEAAGLLVPLDLGAKGSCHIGGNVATNAGGLRYLRWGSLHGSVLGLEVVLADGTVLENLSTLRKDNTGYDLKQLFIGSEGSLGVITGVALHCPRRPKSANVVLLACPSYDAVLRVFGGARRDLAEILSAYEFFDSASLQLVLRRLADSVHYPLEAPPERHPFYVLLETMGSDEEHDRAKIDRFLAELLAAGAVVDGTTASSATQARGIWRLREGIPEALARHGATYKYDISLPQSVMYRMVEETRERVGARGETFGYGHLGDGNLHLNVVTPAWSAEVQQLLEPYVYEWTARHRGSISAEHGLGVMKPGHIHYSKPPAMVDLMRVLKRTLDPNGILNPYKVLTGLW